MAKIITRRKVFIINSHKKKTVIKQINLNIHIRPRKEIHLFVQGYRTAHL